MHGRVALVTGLSRRVGRGVALALHAAGATAHATGRTVLAADLPRGRFRLPCDHSNDAQTAAIFAKLASNEARLDVWVNNAWGGYEGMVEDGRFTCPAPFFEPPLRRSGTRCSTPAWARRSRPARTPPDSGFPRAAA